MSPPPIDLIGRTIGEYLITARVGEGGMGVVFEGTHPLIGKRVAVKVLLPSLTSNPDQVGRFLSEARAVNAVRHRGIVDIFSFGQLPDGAHYFVMEFLEGRGFEKIIPQRGPLLVGEALLWASEVLEALSAAHEVGIIHRDIKPSNLFLVDTGRSRPYVKLLDFGIAKVQLQSRSAATPQTRASVVVGTPEYMAPEQVRGLAVSPQTDLYALGVVLYEMLTRRRLFRSENPLRAMWMHAEEPPPHARDFNASVPRALDDLLQWMLRKEPTDRPRSALELLKHVEDVLRDLPPELGPEASPAFSGRPISGVLSRAAPRSATAIPPPGPPQHPPLPVLASRAGERKTALTKAIPPPQGSHSASTAKVPALAVPKEPDEPSTGLQPALELPWSAPLDSEGAPGRPWVDDAVTGVHEVQAQLSTASVPALQVPPAPRKAGDREATKATSEVAALVPETRASSPSGLRRLAASEPGSAAREPPAGQTPSGLRSAVDRYQRVVHATPGSAATAELPALVPGARAPSKATLSRRLVELERRLLGPGTPAGGQAAGLRSALERAHRAIDDADSEEQRRSAAALLDRLDGGRGG